MSDQVIYTVGGTVQAGGGIYISRDADEELLQLCRAGEFCYVLAARQMGKSSLMVATRERLAAEGIRSVEIDLTQIGKLSELTAEQWYLGLIDFIVDQLDLDVDYIAWWDERAHLGPTQRLSQFLQQVVLEQVSERVVIFIDEIDSTLNLDFTDDFFAAIRACYNARASDPAFKRLSFVLLGVATPSDLISDPQRTPFNIGRRMDLTDFTERQAIPLADGFGLPPVEARQVLTWVLDWTGGHPYLTQRLCAAAAASPTKNWDTAAVDKLVEKTFFGEQSAQDSNLRFVRDMLTQRAPDKVAVLKTYRRIRAGHTVSDEERSLVKTHLKLSGIVKVQSGCLRIRNEIYRRVFDSRWVRANTPRNWAPIAIGTAILIALLAVGFVIHNVWVADQVDASTLKFYQATTPEERAARLADIFEPPCLFQVTDYDYQARELFYGLSREEQLALFNVNIVEDSDVIILIKGLYITLANIDGTDSTRPLLEEMVQALGYLDGTEETNALEKEINSWLRGRELAKQNQYADALAEYNNAITLNGENPSTLYERARVLVELSEYQQALSDLDQVMAIARRAPAPTPTASPSTTTLTTSSTLTPTSTSTPGTDMTPSEASPSASVTATSASFPTHTETPIPTATPTPASITSEFATTGQMISAVRNIIYGNPDLVSSLVSAPSSAYPNLREFGLVPTLTPTLVVVFLPARVTMAIPIPVPSIATPICAGFAQYIVSASGVQHEAGSLCQPDGEVAEIGLESNSELVLDMGVGNVIVDAEGSDFYFYEPPNGPGIYLDHTEVAVAPDDGSGQPGNFIVVFVWGDDDLSNNGTILSKYLPEVSNRAILASDLHKGTGIGIDVGRDDGARYRFIRFRTYPPSATPGENEFVQVDAVERAGFDMTPTPAVALTPTLVPTATLTPKPDAMVNVEVMNLRSGPGTNYDIVGQLKQGDVLEVTGRDPAGNWLKVVTPRGEKGWVAVSILKINLSLVEVALAQIPPTPTPAHTPTATPTPTPAATPTLLPAPELLEPGDAARFLGHRAVLLTWEWIRPLGEDEYFSVRIRPEGGSTACCHPHTKEMQHRGNLYGCTNGKHYWSVTVAREDPESPTGWRDISEASEERWFDFFERVEEEGGGGGELPPGP